jgi:hypothetical protein
MFSGHDITSSIHFPILDAESLKYPTIDAHDLDSPLIWVLVSCCLFNTPWGIHAASGQRPFSLLKRYLSGALWTPWPVLFFQNPASGKRDFIS